MSGIEYQKIELHSTENLAKDQERIEYEKETAQRLMMENQIPFSIEIEEADLIGSNYRKTGTAYVLNLIVRKEDAEKVIELLDREGGFGYFVDLDETYDPDAEKEETEDENISFVEIPEELKEEEPENLKDDSDPIKIYGEDNGNITIEFKSLNSSNFALFIMRLALLFSGMAIVLVQVWLLANAVNELDYKMITTIFVTIVFEFPVFMSFYNLLKKKKGE